MEIWKQIPKFPLYEASNLGRIRHIKHKKIRKQRLHKDGYYQITIPDNNNVKKTVRVHKLVANAFILNSNDKVIDHINRDRTDNRLDNLRCADYFLNNKNKSLGMESFVRKIITMHKRGIDLSDIVKMLVD